MSKIGVSEVLPSSNIFEKDSRWKFYKGDGNMRKHILFFANQFFKFDGIEWMKIKESDGIKLENIIKDIPTD